MDRKSSWKIHGSMIFWVRLQRPRHLYSVSSVTPVWLIKMQPKTLIDRSAKSSVHMTKSKTFTCFSYWTVCNWTAQLSEEWTSLRHSGSSNHEVSGSGPMWSRAEWPKVRVIIWPSFRGCSWTWGVRGGAITVGKRHRPFKKIMHFFQL